MPYFLAISIHNVFLAFLAKVYFMLKSVAVLYPLCRLEDVGRPKAEVAAKRVMERVNGVNITPHFCRIEDKPLDFYSDFSIIVLGLDSIEARSYINSVACGFLGLASLPGFCFIVKWRIW